MHINVSVHNGPPNFNTVPTRYIPENTIELKKYVIDLVAKAKRTIPDKYLPQPGKLDVVRLNKDLSFDYDEVEYVVLVYFE